MATDLTGQVFGRLTVLRQSETMYISPSGKTKDRRWVCQCSCGNEVAVREDGLKSGETRSCGCLQREAAARNKIDLTGKRFGRLTVLKSVPLEHPEKGGTVNGWLCRCDCGNEKIVTPSHLLRGGTMSCGCLSLEKNAARTNPEGQNILGRYNGTVVSLIDPKRKINSNNTSGVKGVYWSERNNAWIARISVQGRRIYLGSYNKLDDAIAARKAGEEQYYAPIIEEYKAITAGTNADANTGEDMGVCTDNNKTGDKI